MTIRPLVVTDAAVLAAIQATSLPQAEAWGREAWVSLLGTPGTWGLLDTRGGLLLLRGAADQADVVTLAVTPAARRQGIASAMLAAATAHLRGLGVTALFLEVADTNAAARALYRRCGFVAVGTRPRYYPDGTDALLLHLSLSTAPPDTGMDSS